MTGKGTESMKGAQLAWAACFILLAALPLLSVISHPAAPAVLLASLACALAAAGISGSLKPAFRLHRLAGQRVTLGLFGAMLALAMLSSLWSLDAARSLEKAMTTLPVGFVFVAFLLLSDAFGRAMAAHRWALLLAGLMMAASVLIMVDQTFEIFVPFSPERGLTHNNTAAQLMSMLIWPVAWFAWQRSRLLALATFALCTLAVFMSQSQASQLALILGAAALFPLCLLKAKAPLVGAALATLFLFVLVLAGPLADALFADMDEAMRVAASIDHRIELWSSYLAGIMERPLLGWGFDASRLPSRPEYAASLGVWAPTTGHHPHNLALALWFEMGIIGLALGIGLIWLVAGGIRRLDPGLQPFATLILLTAMLQMGVGKHIWQDKWLAAMVATAVLTLFVNALHKAKKV